MQLQLNIKVLKELRTRLGLSQEGLAKACDDRQFRVSIATIKRAEAGSPVAYRTINELARFYGVPLERLLDSNARRAVSASDPLPLVTILWLRLDNNDDMEVVLRLLKQRGSLWQEHLGSVVLAAFGNYDNHRKGYVQAQKAALFVRDYLTGSKSSGVSFYAALRLAPGSTVTNSTGLEPEVLQWFAQNALHIPVNTIFVSDDLYRLCDSYFSYHATAIEGLWSLDYTLCEHYRVPLEGRSQELLEAGRLLDDIAGVDRGLLLTLCGAGGIGKTRLLRALHELARLRGIAVLDVDLESTWQDSPQLLAQTLLSVLLEKLGGLAELQQLLAHLDVPLSSEQEAMLNHLLIGAEPQPVGWRALPSRQWEDLPEVFIRLLQATAEQLRQKLVVSVDNFHLAAAHEQRLLQTLITRLEKTSVSFMVTYRPSAEVDEIFSHLQADALLRHDFEIGPLTPAAVEKICRVFGAVNPVYRERCAELADGVPLYLIQLLSAYRDCNRDTPASLQLMLEQKTYDLQPRDRQVIELLSVINTPLDLTAVAELVECPEYSPQDLIHRQLVEFTDKGAVKLCHQLMRHLICESMDTTLLSRYHGQVAEFIENQTESPQRSVKRLAEHYQAAGKSYKSAYYNYLWASELLLQGLYAEAEASLNASLAELQKTTDAGVVSLEIDVQLALSNVYKVRYGWVSPLLKKTYERILDLSELGARDQRMGLSLFGLWTIELATLNFTSAETMALRLRQLSAELGDDQGRLYAEVALCNTFFWRGNHPAAITSAHAVFDGYIESYTESSLALLGLDPRVLAGCFGALSASLIGRDVEADQFRRQILTKAQETNHDFSLAIALQGSAWLEFHRGDAVTTLKAANNLETLAREKAFPFYRGVAALFQGWAQHTLYHEPSAAQNAHDGYWCWLASSGDKVAYSLYGVILGTIYVERSRFSEARTLLDQCIDVARKTGEECYLPELYRLMMLCPNVDKKHALEQGLSYAENSPVLLQRLTALAQTLAVD